MIGSSKSPTIRDVAAIACVKAEVARKQAAFATQVQLKLEKSSLEAMKVQQQASLKEVKAKQKVSLGMEQVLLEVILWRISP